MWRTPRGMPVPRAVLVDWHPEMFSTATLTGRPRTDECVALAVECWPACTARCAGVTDGESCCAQGCDLERVSRYE